MMSTDPLRLNSRSVVGNFVNNDNDLTQSYNPALTPYNIWKTGNYDGNKLLLWAAGIGIAAFGVYKFYTYCMEESMEDENSDYAEPSFTRGYAKNWMDLAEDDPMREITLRQMVCPSLLDTELDMGVIIPEKLPNWHYADFGNPWQNYFNSDEDELNENDDDMHSQNELILMHAIKLLGPFSTEDFAYVFETVQKIELDKGDLLIKPGDPDDCFYILKSGSLSISVKMEPSPHRSRIKKVRPGGIICSLLSVIDVLSDQPRPIRTVEIQALKKSTAYKVPLGPFREVLLRKPKLLMLCVRHLIRRIYQVVFIALHRILGLSSELCEPNVNNRIVPSPEFLAKKRATHKDKDDAITGAMNYFGLSNEHRDLFKSCKVIVAGNNQVVLSAGKRTTRFIYVHKGELEVTGVRAKQDIDANEKNVLFYVTEGQGIGALSMLTEDANIFHAAALEKALILIVPEKILKIVYLINPLAILPIIHSVVRRLSAFTRQMDFGIEFLNLNSNSPPVYKTGDKPEHTYLVLSGRLRSVYEEDGKKKVIGDYGRDDWVGLVETLTRKKRTKTVIAVRDTVVAKIPQDLLKLVKMRFPVVTIRLLEFLGQRVAKGYKSGLDPKLGILLAEITEKVSVKQTIAIIPIKPNICDRMFAYELKICGEHMRRSVKILRLDDAIDELGPEALAPQHEHVLISWQANIEQQNDLVLFLGERGHHDSLWSIKCMQNADTVLILAHGEDEDKAVTEVEELILEYAPRAKKELVLLHNFTCLPQGTRHWLEPRNWLSFHHHISIPDAHEAFFNCEDFEEIQEYFNDPERWEFDKHSEFPRLLRWVTGSTTGIVLGGGGAKGASHIGMLYAILNEDIPIDRIAGASIGAFIGGLYSMYPNIKTIDYFTGKWFSHMTKWSTFLMDVTMPLTSIMNGERFNNSLKSLFGETQIEDLWIPYFCATTDLTGNGGRVHTYGSLWRYCRGSMTLATYYPPICDPKDGHLLMDGGYTNLVPANVMRDLGARFIIAIDVASDDAPGTSYFGDHLSGIKLILSNIIPFFNAIRVPHFFSIQTQLSFIQSALYMDMVKKMDLQTAYFRPPIDEFGGADFSQYDKIKFVGYKYGNQMFHKKLRPSDPLVVQWLKMNPDYEQRARGDPKQAQENDKIIKRLMIAEGLIGPQAQHSPTESFERIQKLHGQGGDTYSGDEHDNEAKVEMEAKSEESLDDEFLDQGGEYSYLETSSDSDLDEDDEEEDKEDMDDLRYEKSEVEIDGKPYGTQSEVSIQRWRKIRKHFQIENYDEL